MHEIPKGKITCIEKCVLRGTRPRHSGFNARVPAHGEQIADPVVRVRTDGGAWGLGWSSIDEATAQALLGKEIGDLFQLPDGCLPAGRPLDLPLWDLVARMMALPLYRLLGARGKREVEVYDGSIYIDDLEATDEEQVQDIFRREVATGHEHGYLHFKIKVGRGARWMPTDAGLKRDELVIRTVREAAGPQAKVLIDANMGNTLNTAIALLDACADVGIYWFEEPFAEDPPLNQALKEHIVENDWDTLVADGEFSPPPYFFDLVEKGFIDVVQHDFRALGLTWWRSTAARLEQWNALCAPHCWGSYVERFHHAHFAASIPNFCLLEAAPATMPGLITDGWRLDASILHVPDTLGAGLDIDPRIFAQGMEDREGFRVVL